MNKGSILGPLFFLIYIKDVTDGLKCNVKLFADDTSIFTVAHDPNTAAINMNHDLSLINLWTRKWRMSFNPDPAKQPYCRPSLTIVFLQIVSSFLNLFQTDDVLIFFKIFDEIYKKNENAAILKIIKLSTINCQGRFTVNYPKFLSGTLIQREM